MKMKKIDALKCTLLFMFVSLASFIASAQETTSEIQGTITDGTNGIIGVVISAIHQPTGTNYTTTTRKDGRFNLPNVKIGGPYSITASHVGFKTENSDGIFLSLGQAYRADYTLIPESKKLTEVVVTTNARQGNLFNNNRNGSQEIINRTQLERLPTINRSIQDFVKLEPSSNGLNIGGRSNQYNNMTVDGANFNNSFGLSSVLGGQTNSQPISLEAIEQIQVNISPYDVTQGGFAGTGINTVTRSGTNTIKATIYTYVKNQNYQGYEAGNIIVPKTPLSYRINGLSIGGPIIKNKLFVYFSGETVKQSLPATSFIASDANNAPASGSVSVANADTLNALASFLSTKYGYNPGKYQGYNFQTNSDKITVKLDWNINAKNTFTVKYNYLKSFADQFASTSRPGAGQITGGQPGNTSMPFFGSGYVINNNFNIFIAELNTRLNNKLSNKLQIGYTALRDFRSAHSASSTFPLVDILNGGNIYTTFGYEPFTYSNILSTDVYQFSDIVKLYKGAHEITMGTQDYYRKYQNAFAPGYQGGYQFNSLTDFYNSANNGTVNAKSYYLQYSALPGGAFPFAFAGSTELGVFVQDKWRVKKDFTLTYGLRVDYTIYKQAFTDNTHFDSLQFAGGQSYNIGKAPANVPIISPRLGFNWDVDGDKTFQIRGGLGIFSGPPPFVWISNQASNNGIQFGSFTRPANAVAFNVSPDAYRPTSGASNAAYSVALVDNNFKYPTVLKSNVGFDKKFKGDWVFTGELSYSRDLNAVYYSNINFKETNAFSLAGVDNRLRYLTPVSNSNKYYFDGSTLSNPNIGNAILMKNSSKGYAIITTLRLQKNSRNFSGGISYTYSLATNSAEGGSTASSLWSAPAVSNQDPNAANNGLASYYQPHRVLINASYKFSYAKYCSTTIGIIGEMANNGTGSYVYNGDLNGDGNSGNDLIYIPRTQAEINLVKNGSGGNGTGSSTDTRTPAQIWSQLDAFISSSPYLNRHRGQYAERNGNVSPLYYKLDMNITQDFSFKTKKDRHTLRFSLDISNLANFMNKYWGLVKSPTTTNFLRFEGLTTTGTVNTPSYSFPYSTGTTPYTQAFSNSASIASRWVMQFGIRYLFN